MDGDVRERGFGPASALLGTAESAGVRTKSGTNLVHGEVSSLATGMTMGDDHGKE